MTVVLDLNVLLDVLQKREPHVRASSEVLSLFLKRKIQMRIAARAVTTLHYVVAKHAGREKADETVDWLLARFPILPAGADELRRARSLRMPDFEDAVVAVLAESARAAYVVTRNVGDFRGSPVAAITPEELLSRLSS